MTSTVSSKNKEKRPKGKIVFKKKNGTKKQKTVSPGVEPGLSARKQLLGHCTTVTHML